MLEIKGTHREIDILRMLLNNDTQGCPISNDHTDDEKENGYCINCICMGNCLQISNAKIIYTD